jgi:bifunctional DNA-binding transcriptional regulator/antitoxin component of YhaV-PrlF toxin-antitoxin module
MPEEAIATLSPDFQLAIPEAVRKAYGLKAGQQFAFIPRNGGLMLVRVPTLQELRGIARGADPSGYRDRDDRY